MIRQGQMESEVGEGGEGQGMKEGKGKKGGHTMTQEQVYMVQNIQ